MLVSIGALLTAIFAIIKSNRNTSASTMVTLNEGFRHGWQRFLSAETEASKQYEFSELMNVFEIASAIYLEKSVSGVSGELLEEYVFSVFTLLEGNSDARARIEAMRDSPKTFKYIKLFLKQIKRNGKPHRFAQAFSERANGTTC